MANSSKIKSVQVINLAKDDSLFLRKASTSSSSKVWNWGGDNLFPLKLASLARENAIHRGIVRSKVDYIVGRAITADEKNIALQNLIARANGKESLMEVVSKVLYDRFVTGNAFIEIAIIGRRLVLFHQDATRCRLSRPNNDGEGGDYVIISKDWAGHLEKYDERLPLFPNFVDNEDGSKRSILHISDYEPGFEHYGVPTFIGGLKSARIGSKTTSWNESRLDNSFQLSGVMELVSEEDNDDDLAQLKRQIEAKFAGTPGQVLFVVSNDAGAAKFTPIESSDEGDWLQLHNVSKNDMVTAHSWFMALAGLDYTTGLSADRLLNEYSVALTTVIEPEQERLRKVLQLVASLVGLDVSSLMFVNRPPITEKPAYMRVWEARKADGLDYDPDDEAQQAFLANISQKQQQK